LLGRVPVAPGLGELVVELGGAQVAADGFAGQAELSHDGLRLLPAACTRFVPYDMSAPFCSR
jgi:hypothetical protein